MKTRKGGGRKKAINYGNQGRQTSNKNEAEMQSKDPCSKARKCKLRTWLPRTATDNIGLSFTLAKITFILDCKQELLGVRGWEDGKTERELATVSLQFKYQPLMLPLASGCPSLHTNKPTLIITPMRTFQYDLQNE